MTTNVDIVDLSAPGPRTFAYLAAHRPCNTLADRIANGARIGACYKRPIVELLPILPTCAAHDATHHGCISKAWDMTDHEMLEDFGVVYDPTLRF